MNIEKRKNGKGDKFYFYIGNGRKAGERIATGIFIYIRPKNQVEKNHNKEALILVETKKSEVLLEQQAIGTGFIPSHKFKANFLDYYAEFVKNNVRKGNRHLENSYTQFRSFLGKTFLPQWTLPRNCAKASGNTGDTMGWKLIFVTRKTHCIRWQSNLENTANTWMAYMVNTGESRLRDFPI